MNQNEQDNKPERTAMMILIEHEQGVLERMSNGFVHPQHVQQQKDRMECLNKLLQVEKIQIIEAVDATNKVWEDTANTVFDGAVYYNQKYTNHGK